MISSRGLSGITKKNSCISPGKSGLAVAEDIDRQMHFSALLLSLHHSNL
jgi:hypothetical protein